MNSPAATAVIQGVVENLSRRAKKDTSGIYWDSVSPAAASRASLDLSLMTGTPGIILFLSEYYAALKDPAVLPIIEQSIDWVAGRLRKTRFIPGFYVGSLGSIYAIATAEWRCTGSVSSATQSLLIEALEVVIRDHPKFRASLGNGIGGALLGLELFPPEHRPRDSQKLRRLMLHTLVEHMRPAGSGIYWDRYPDTIKPSPSFLTGNAGVEFLLSHYGHSRSKEAIAALVESSLAYDDTLYEDAMGNWHDVVNESRFRDLRELAGLHSSIVRGNAGSFAIPGSSIFWSAGAAGILATRKALQNNGLPFGGKPLPAIGEMIVAELRHRKDLTRDNISLATGLTGVAMSLAFVDELRYRDTVIEPVQKVVLKQWENARRFNLGEGTEPWTLGLLNGDAGIGYFLLRSITGRLGESSILAPTFSVDTAPDVSLDFVRRAASRAAFPLSVAAGVKPEPDCSRIHLAGLAAGLRRQTSSSLQDRLIDYELQKHAFDAEAPAYMYLFALDAFRLQLYETEVELLHDEELLRLRVRMGRECRLSRRPSSCQNGSTDAETEEVLWRQTPSGIREVVINGLQSEIFSLLADFRSGAHLISTLRARRGVHCDAGQSLTESVVACLRNGLKAGILETDQRSVLCRLLHRFRKILFHE